MIEHIALLKFSQDTTTEQKEELIRKTLALQEIIPGIIDIQQGMNFSNRSKGYDMGLTVRFKDQTALEHYGPHPAHQEVVQYLKQIGIEDSIFVDFEI